MATVTISLLPASRTRSVDLTVTGLITPSACTPSLSSGGVVEFGKVSAEDLNSERETNLGTQTMSLSITCDAPNLYALQALDQRASSATRADAFGLGRTEDARSWGWYAIALRNPIADGVPVQPIGSTDEGATWHPNDLWMPGIQIAFASMTEVNQPLRVRKLTLDLDVSASLPPTTGLTLTDEIAIDGSATLTLVYL
ncbi:DUF1120 domain-containing protein [Nocardia sp. NPDC056000]|uniref:DUF1120 domain-containing protein n=1 Tax=Nocardia sp. NPDC056000 TaxID=3345674 RepID=UPI0035D5CBDE